MSIRRCSLLLALFVFASSAFAAPRSFIFGVVDSNPKTTVYDGIIRHLNEVPDLKVTVKVFPSYDAMYAAFKKKEVDMGYIGAVKYVEAHQDSGAVPLVTDGQVTSVVFVAKSSPIHTMEELKGKKFAFGYEESTSTYLMPLLLMSKHHIGLSELGGKVMLGTSQEAITDAVISGRADAGAVVAAVFDQRKDKLRALETSEAFPGAPVIVHPDMDAKTVEMLRSAFLSYKPSGNDPNQRFNHGVMATNDAAFNKVRFLVHALFGKTYH